MLIQRVCVLLLCLISVSSLSLEDQSQGEPVLQEAAANVLQALSYWKITGQDNPDLVDRLEQVETKLKDPDTTSLEIALYGVCLNQMRSLPQDKQILFLDSLLAKSSYELMKEAAVLIKMIRSSRQTDSTQQ